MSELILEQSKDRQVLIIKKQKEVQILCAPAREAKGASKETAAKIFGSHDWVIQETKSYGTGGVLLKYTCARCDAEGFATFVNRGY